MQIIACNSASKMLLCVCVCVCVYVRASVRVLLFRGERFAISSLGGSDRSAKNRVTEWRVRERSGKKKNRNER